MSDSAHLTRLIWALLSIIVAAVSTVSYWYDAVWLEGKPKLKGVDPTSTNLTSVRTALNGSGLEVKFTFSTFRRCNHWVLKRSDTDNGYGYVINEKCGGYKSFVGEDGIPSDAWRACTVIGGIAWGLLDLVAPVAFGAFFIALPNVWAAICGILQAIAGKTRRLRGSQLGFPTWHIRCARSDVELQRQTDSS